MISRPVIAVVAIVRVAIGEMIAIIMTSDLVVIVGIFVMTVLVATAEIIVMIVPVVIAEIIGTIVQVGTDAAIVMIGRVAIVVSVTAVASRNSLPRQKQATASATNANSTKSCVRLK